MASMIERWKARAGERWAALRARSGAVDHLARAFLRYDQARGDRLAAALTCYGFLSFFPLLALAYSLLGYFVGVSDAARDLFLDAVTSQLPGLADQIDVEQIARSRAAAGIIGLAGLLLTGLGWVEALRESLRTIWGNPPKDEDIGFVARKLTGVGVLAFLGSVMITGVAVSAMAGSATQTVLGWLDLEDVTGAKTALRVLSLLVAVAFDAMIFLVLFSRLTGTHAPLRSIAHGAVLGAVGFETLKQVATLLLARTTENPVYASFAVLVGLVVWINLVSRYLLVVAAWTATRTPVLATDAEVRQSEAAEEAAAAEEAEAVERAENAAEKPNTETTGSTGTTGTANGGDGGSGPKAAAGNGPADDAGRRGGP